MSFGDPQDFAIEAGAEPGLVPPSAVWGFMRVWCGGVPLGNLGERFCALDPSAREFAWLSTRLDDLWDESLTDMDDGAAWDLLDGLLYGYHGDIEVKDDRTPDELRMGWDRFGKFSFLTKWGEQFDGFKSILLCPPVGPVRILSRRLPASLGLSVLVTKGAVVAASRRFVRWFKGQEARLRSLAQSP